MKQKFHGIRRELHPAPLCRESSGYIQYPSLSLLARSGESNASVLKKFLFHCTSFFLLLLILFAPCAEARKISLSSGSGFGLGFNAGAERAPRFGTIPGSNSTISRFFSFEPFVDFENLILKATASIHYHPNRKGIGSDSAGYFEDSSESSSVHFGAKILFVPFISKQDTLRLYFFGGIAQAFTNITNKRQYITATGTITNSYKEKLDGKKEELSAGVGSEFMLVQNYSLSVEAGYRRVNFDRLTYDGTTDLQGITRLNGAVAVDPKNGLNKELALSSAFASVGLNILF